MSSSSPACAPTSSSGRRCAPCARSARGTWSAAAPGEPSRVPPWRELVALAPDLVVIALCGFDVARAQTEFATVADPDARTLFTRRVEFLDGNAYTSRPGPRLVDAAEMLSRLIPR